MAYASNKSNTVQTKFSKNITEYSCDDWASELSTAF